MSTPAPVIVAGFITIAPVSTPLPAGANPQASLSCTVTDAAGTAYPAVLLNGSESPPWSFAGSWASGVASILEQALDASGTAIGASATVQVTIAAAAPPATFEAPGPATFTPAAASAATAAVHAALKKA
jgi:hypothetical protein